jgi:hypothetical protein
VRFFAEPLLLRRIGCSGLSMILRFEGHSNIHPEGGTPRTDVDCRCAGSARPRAPLIELVVDASLAFKWLAVREPFSPRKSQRRIA